MPAPEPEGPEVVRTVDGRFVSYAQNAEDVVLARALRPDERRGTWIDIGAGHPRVDSVTAAFSVRGWHGVNVEPRAAMHRLLTDDRPRDVNVCAAVADRPGTATLWSPERDANLSTTSPTGRDRLLGGGDQLAETEVRVTTLAALCEEHVEGEIDFLKVDVEGTEREVLGGADWQRWRPRVVVVEAVVPETSNRREECGDLLREAGYEHVLFDGLNSFYTRTEEPGLAVTLAAGANISDDYVSSQLYQKMRGIERAIRYNENLTEQLRAAETRIAALTVQVAEAQRDTERARRELDRLRATKTFRSTAWMRRLYSRLRAR